RGSLRKCPGGAFEEEAGRARTRTGSGRSAGAPTRDQPDGCAARQHRRRDPEKAGGAQRQGSCWRQDCHEEEDGPLKQNAEGDCASLRGTVAFTGRLASMKRADAFALVRKHGGKPREGVTKQTDVLVVGELGWPLLDDGRPSNSLAQAKSYRVPIASERQFLEWLGRSISQEEARAYTVDQLASLSKLPKDVIDQPAMFGLIEARGGRFGFRDLAAARQGASLLAAATALSGSTRHRGEIRQ